MFDPIPILLAREAVRADIEDPPPERRPRRVRPFVAARLHRLADRVEGRHVARRPAAHSLGQRSG
jgi:hypothetical protein